MSYILDALKKADRERTLGDVPDLETPHWGARRRPPSYRWAWALLAVLIGNGIMLAMLLGRDDDSEPAPLNRPARVDALPVTPVPRTETTAVQPSQRITRPREPVYVPPPVRSTPRAAVTTAPAYTPPGTAARAAAPSVTSSGIPHWDDLSLEFRSSLELPHIDVQVYDDDPARRFLLVNLQKYREGESLDSGAVVEQINVDSVQLNYQGTRFIMSQ